MSGEEIDDLVSGSDTFVGDFNVSAESGCNSNDGTADADHFSHYSVRSADDDNMLSKMEYPPCSVVPMDIE